MKADHFFINGKRVSVEQKHPRDMDDNCGYFVYGNLEIFIDESIQRDLKIDTFIHEMIHAISYCFSDKPDRLTERQTVNMTNGLIAFLRENAHINLYTLIEEGLE